MLVDLNRTSFWVSTRKTMGLRGGGRRDRKEMSHTQQQKGTCNSGQPLRKKPEAGCSLWTVHTPHTLFPSSRCTPTSVSSTSNSLWVQWKDSGYCVLLTFDLAKPLSCSDGGSFLCKRSHLTRGLKSSSLCLETLVPGLLVTQIF